PALAGRANARAAGVWRLQTGMLHCLEQHFTCSHIELMTLACKCHAQAATARSLRHHRQLGGEALQMDQRGVDTMLAKGRGYGFHKRFRSADEGLGSGPAGDLIDNGLAARYALFRIEPDTQLQPP